jgi:hypothetical protein
MKRTTLVIAILLLAGLATAQTMIPLPAYSTTYTSPSGTRGFYCQAPLDFTVVGLRVPDEKQHGKQNVCLYRHTSAPPAYSSTVPLTPIFSKFGESSANIIPCSEKFKKGEWLIAIGACGDSTTMLNSYGPSGCFQSNVLGMATTLCRCGIQANIVTAKPPHPVWSENAYNVCRVEVYVASATLAGSGTPSPGGTIKFALSASADTNLPYQMGSSLGNGPIPIDTRQLELSADALLVLSAGGLLPTVFKDYVGKLDASGAGNASIDIPNYPILKGVRIYSAFLTLLASAPSGVSSISNTFLFTIQ